MLFVIAFSNFILYYVACSHQLEAETVPNAQNRTTTSAQVDIFRVVVSLFGVKGDTGNIVSFVKVNNLTAGKFFNASKENVEKNSTGIIETQFSFPNRTIPVGTKYEACMLKLDNLNVSCASGYNSPGPRTEIEQIQIP